MNTNTNTNRRNERGLFGIAQQAYRYEEEPETPSKNNSTTKGMRVLAAIMPRIGWSTDVQDEIDQHLSRMGAPLLDERNYISLCTDIDMDSYHSRAHRRSSSVKYLPRNERRSSTTTAPRRKSLSPKGMKVEIQRRRKSLSPKGTKIEAERSSHNRRKSEKSKEKSPERALLRRAATTSERKPRERRRPSVSAKRDKDRSRLHRSHPELSQTRGKSSQEEPLRRSESLHRRRARRHGTPQDEPSRRSAATESSSQSSRREKKHAGSKPCKNRSNHSAEGGGSHNRFPRRTRSKSMTHIDLIDQDNNNHRHGSKARSNKLSSKSARSLSPSSNQGFRTTRPAPRSKPSPARHHASSPTSPKEVCRLQWQPSFDSIDTWTAEDLVGAPSEPLLPAFPDSSDDRSGRSHSKR